MDHSADSGTLPTHTTVEGPAGQQELSLSSIHCETESGGTFLLQLLEFKTHLLEAVEELHIRRDAETRFEDQLSKLVLEKQELEWEKESLKHQIEKVANQHTESLTNIKKQAKIRNIEEEKWKYQVSAELKDKEINNLKEELKSLQLLKYNLEKKTSQLEQKLALQSRSKDSHLNQLGEVEKRFSALSRQCAAIKQAHERLEQNVDEAMSINKKLSSANEKQEAAIGSLKKELEEVSKQLIKAKMTSVTQTHSPTGKEQQIQLLHQKLIMEAEMNKKLCEENEAVRTEKQEVMRSLQQAQHLILTQTQTVSRVELELQTHREQYQALKQEHEMMREKSKAVEDKVAQLMESYATSKTSWDKEKTVFLDRIKNEQQDLQAVKEAYEALHHKHTELSSLAIMRDVSAKVFPTRADEEHAEQPLNKPISSSELCSFGSLHHLSSSLAKNLDCLEDTGAVTKLVATGATGGEEVLNHDHQSQYKLPLNNSNLFMCPLITNKLLSFGSHSGTGTNTNILNKFTCNSNTSGTDPDVVSDFISTSSSVSDTNFQISNGASTAVPSPERMSDKNEEGNAGMNEKRGKDDWKQDHNNRKEDDRNTEQQWNKEEVLRGVVKEEESTEEKRGTLMTQTTDRADREENNKGSAEDEGDTRNPETETRDRAEGEGTHEVEERGKTAVHTSETPDTQIPDQTTADTTIEDSKTQQVIDFMDTKPLPAVSEASDRSLSRQRVDCVCVIQEQHLCHGEVQTQDAEPINYLPNHAYQVAEKACNTSAANFPCRFSEPLNESSMCCPQTNAALLVTQTDGAFSIQETNPAATEYSDPPDIKSNMKQSDEMCDTNVTEDCLLVRTLVESQISPKISGVQENRQHEPLVTDDGEGDSSPYRKSEDQLNVDTQENGTCIEESKLKDVCVEIAKNTAEFESEVESLKLHENESAETECSRCYEQPPVKEVLDNTEESFLHISNTYRPSFDWDSAQRKTAISRTKSDVSGLHQFVGGTEQSTSWSAGNLRHPSSTIPMFLKGKHNKVPLVITRASELLNASSVSGTAASLRRHQQGEWKAKGATSRESAAAETESRASMSISPLPVSTSSSTSGCSRAPTSASDFFSECDWEPSCFQEREDQQSSFRAQIFRIEQFLKTERLSLPKRRRTDN
ncbi:myosin-1 [Anabas testudineus]|uniref:myosin-1 n=1 Tax=Anabas testudineus TaxID=64144 RepID=UPI000E462117|nr:myosin-1 [Anabas testudineus]